MSDSDSYIMRVYIDVYLLQNGAPKDLMLDTLVSYFDMEMGMSYIPKFPGEEKHQSWIDLIYLFQVSASRCIVGTPQFAIHTITRIFSGRANKVCRKNTGLNGVTES